MEWKITFASDLIWDKKTYMTNINTIEDLKKLSQKYNERLIIDFVKNEITVYDDYVE